MCSTDASNRLSGELGDSRGNRRRGVGDVVMSSARPGAHVSGFATGAVPPLLHDKSIEERRCNNMLGVWKCRSSENPLILPGPRVAAPGVKESRDRTPGSHV